MNSILGMDGAGVVMINYDVKIDKENHRFVINGSIGENSIPIEIPQDNPTRSERDLLICFYIRQI